MDMNNDDMLHFWVSAIFRDKNGKEIIVPASIKKKKKFTSREMEELKDTHDGIVRAAPEYGESFVRFVHQKGNWRDYERQSNANQLPKEYSLYRKSMIQNASIAENINVGKPLANRLLEKFDAKVA